MNNHNHRAALAWALAVASAAGAGAQSVAPPGFRPGDLAVAADGRIVIADAATDRLYAWSPAEDRLAPLPKLVTAAGVTVRPRRIVRAGDRWFALDTRAHSVFELDLATGAARRVAGDGAPGAAGVRLGHPSGLGVAASGDLLIADLGNGRVRRVASSGHLTTWVSAAAFAAAGIRDAAPADVAVGADGTVWIAELGRSCLVRCAADAAELAVVTATRGPEAAAGSATGSGRNAGLRRIAVDAAGGVYLVESELHHVRRLAAGGAVTPFAGSGTRGRTGDGGDARRAELSWPVAIAFDAAGAAFIADSGNGAVRRVDPASGVISTVVQAAPAAAPGRLEVVRREPDPTEVVDADVRSRIVAVGKPWHVRDVASGVELVLVPPGEYRRGAGPGDDDVRRDASPAHRVTISRPFYVGRFEVTNAQFRRLSPLHVSLPTPAELEAFGDVSFDGDDQPAVNLTWFDARDYCDRFGFQLPTEAQWEYGARAGATTPYAWGTDPDAAAGQANLANPSLRQRTTREVHALPFEDGHVVTAPAGSFRANGFGAFDMIGNAWEWCADWHSDGEYARCAGGAVDPVGPGTGERRVLRGGSWRCNFAGSTRLSFRAKTPPEARFALQRGVRVVRDAGDPPR